MFKVTTAIKKILKLKKPIKIIQGGTSAGKTYAIIPILIDKAIRSKKKLRITVVGVTHSSVKAVADEIFIKILDETKRFNFNRWNKTDLKYTFSNGSSIQFKVFDDISKAKADGKRDILFINEANHISYNIADELITRSDEVYIDFNPNNEFWVHRELIGDDDVDFINLTFLDNEAISEQALSKILKRKEKAFYDVDRLDLYNENNIKNNYHANWYRVYGEGKIGKLEGTIYQNWEEGIKKDEYKLIGYGQDIGFSNDPSALVAVYEVDKDTIFIEEIFYKRQMVTSDYIKEYNYNNITDEYIYSDRDLRLIAELRSAGFNILAANKKAGSINEGIKILQDYNIIVNISSTNLIYELNNYKWKKTKDGFDRDVAEDDNNHALDALRYVAIMRLGKNNNSNNSEDRFIFI